jgi:ubiquitin carboxyl-terminal hydrolase 22/27/51
MQFMLNTLHLTNGGSTDSEDCKCIVHQTFYGKLSSTVTCDKCKNVTTALDPYMDLSLDIKSQTKKRKANAGAGNEAQLNLRDCLERFTVMEKLESAQYTCRNCDSPQNATKQLSIKRLPPVLSIHLKAGPAPQPQSHTLTCYSVSSTRKRSPPKSRQRSASP